MQYTLTVLNTRLSSEEKLGDYYTEDKAIREAQKHSRKMTSPDVLVVITPNEHKRGYPKCYRMGRLYTL